jgi:hypothetical protein
MGGHGRNIEKSNRHCIALWQRDDFNGSEGREVPTIVVVILDKDIIIS